jgi:hypothetical protein
MPRPFASPLRLTDDDRQGVASLARAHATPHALAWRSRRMVRGAAPEAPTHRRVAAALPCHRQPVSLWRPRSLEPGRAGGHDAPRPGRPRRLSPRGAPRGPVTRDAYAGRPPPPRNAREPGGPGGSAPRPCPSPGAEPLAPLAGARRRRSHTASVCRLVAEPCSGVCRQGARPLPPLCERPALLPAGTPGPRCRRENGSAAAPAPRSHTAGPPRQTRHTCAGVSPPWGAGLDGLLGGAAWPGAGASGPAPHPGGLGGAAGRRPLATPRPGPR